MSDKKKEQDGVSPGEFVTLVYEHQNRYIGLADQKASLLLSAHIAYLGLFLSTASGFWGDANNCLKFLTISTILAIVFVIGFAAKAVYPNTPETPQGLVLWESITNNTRKQYRSTVLEKNDQELLRELTDETYMLAKVADNKYPSVRWAMRGTIVVIGASLVTAYFAYGPTI